ncbi:nucleotidyl transferase AbiEii/AbiGii toxin family protein [Rhodococcus sp. Eu-32]|uniref:nucleotidyl transferase AbiEii/AbiGii toxin family protein n=1 Tax=Rhodococcus sp. Eu-32 TaxID=1017319 RepID=UPI001A9F6C48|nr:nucleotidyl transferase AbiEii/AbiGii toxin family protein [Rhodococcus sp. Eu-32]
MSDVGGGVLTAFQVRVARLFFSLPASKGFLLAGGAALVAQNLTTRPTQDLDFFTSSAGASVGTARDSFEAAAAERDWRVERIQDAETYCRLLIHGDEDLLVDLALDSVPGMAPTASIVGPTFAPEELAGRKLIALFDRAEARDFATSMRCELGSIRSPCCHALPRWTGASIA